MIRRTLILLLIVGIVCVAARWRQWSSAVQPRWMLFEQKASQHPRQQAEDRDVRHANSFKKGKPPLAEPAPAKESGSARAAARDSALQKLARQIELWRKDDPLSQQERLRCIEAGMGEVEDQVEKLNDEIARLEAGRYRSGAATPDDTQVPECKTRLAKLKNARLLCQDQLTLLEARRQDILQHKR